MSFTWCRGKILLQADKKFSDIQEKGLFIIALVLLLLNRQYFIRLYLRTIIHNHSDKPV